jgi:hypothetical protein
MVAAFERAPRGAADPALLDAGHRAFAPAFATLYDDRYADAGWTQLMMIGVFMILHESYGRVRWPWATRGCCGGERRKLAGSYLGAVIGFTLRHRGLRRGWGGARRWVLRSSLLCRRSASTAPCGRRLHFGGRCARIIQRGVAPILTFMLPPLGRRFILPVMISLGVGWWSFRCVLEMFAFAAPPKSRAA